MKNLRFYKLANGECILAQQEVYIIHQGYKVRSPMVIILLQETTGIKIYLNRWVPFTVETEFLLNDDFIITASNVDREMQYYYKQALETEAVYIADMKKMEEDLLDVEWTPDAQADYSDEQYTSGEEGKVKEHPLLRKLNTKKTKKKSAGDYKLN